MTYLEHLAATLPQRLYDHDRESQGQTPVPLSLTSFLHRDEYEADARRFMAVLGPLLAEIAVEHTRRAGEPCPPLSFTGGTCANPEPLPHRCYGACGVHTKPSEPTGHVQ